MMISTITPTVTLILSALGILAGTSLVGVLLKGWKARRFFVKLQKNGLPMPKHNWLFGHLLAIKPYIDKLPGDAHGFIAFGQIAREFPGGIFYLDMWPFVGPMMICTSATAANQATQKSVLATRKPVALSNWFYSIAGGPNLFTMHEEEWKTWRTIFNPGFSQAHVFELIPDIVRETMKYRDVLKEYAQSQELFLLDEATLWFTMDTIGTLVIEAQLNSKQTKNPLATALLSQLRWKLSGQELNPFVKWNPIRPIVEWNNSRRMNNYIGAELDKRYGEYRSGIGRADSCRSKSVISLVLKGYLQQQGSSEMVKEKLEKTFKSYATYQIRTFLFAGHDTTSSTICHMYYLLSKNPDSLAKLRQEHDTVLGQDIESAPCKISENPYLLNQLTYTLAVIKEAMRLFPPASGIREGLEGVNLSDDYGALYPTAKTMVWILHHAMQRKSEYWPEAESFLPQRWLVGPEDPLYPPKGVWRPFEHGPRNCIGQTLTIAELKVILVMTVREFNITDAYAELDRINQRKDIRTAEGERAYQIEQGGAHPADRFPCRVSFCT